MFGIRVQPTGYPRYRTRRWTNRRSIPDGLESVGQLHLQYFWPRRSAPHKPQDTSCGRQGCGLAWIVLHGNRLSSQARYVARACCKWTPRSRSAPGWAGILPA